MDPVRIAVLSDDVLFSTSIAHVLRVECACDVSSFSDRASLLDASASCELAILDAASSGTLLLCATLSAARRIHVLLVGAPDEQAFASEAFQAGARGILTKASAVEDLVKALRVVLGGGIWARPGWLNGAAPAAPPERRHEVWYAHAHCLSRREREVAEAAALGVANKEVARRLAISEATVKAHLSHIFQKLGITRRAELAAIYHGLRPVPAADGPGLAAATPSAPIQRAS